MEINDQNLEALANYLRKTLSPNGDERAEAEKTLKQIERNENYSSLLLTLCERSTIPDEIRRASVITFKNFVKRNWPSLDASSSTTNSISIRDRNHIKEHIIDLMTRSPEHIQQQLSDAITVIGKCDFPDQWPTLLDTMVRQFQQPSTGNSFQSINGVLKTAHSLFERYRYEQKSDELWLEIKLVLEKFAPAFTELFKSLVAYYPQKIADIVEMKNIFDSLYVCIKIFYDLNAQELPEHFEDNLTLYMTHFMALLSFDHPNLHSDKHDPGILDRVKTEICRAVALYADNYSDEFKPFAPQFALAIWSLLTRLNLSPSFDDLVGTAMRFLSTLAARSHHCSMFEGGDILKIVCEQVILPNLFLRESDIEEFEDNPEEYIRKDIEKSDSATRRRAACDFLQALCIFFESQVIALYSQYIETMQKEYLQNPTLNWSKKDTCIFLVLSLASKGETQKLGITKTSSFISIPVYYSNSVLPELQSPDVNSLPLIKADCLKFLIYVRNQLDRDSLVKSLPECTRYLSSQNVVVQTYAAHALERLLLVRHPADQKHTAITKNDLIPYAQSMYDKLFQILTSDKSYENEYVMRAVMRLSSSLHEGVLPYLSQLMDKLVLILRRSSRNPSKPNFNHYLFETITVLIRTSVTQNVGVLNQFEQILFPIFTPIFTEDIAEFVPYVLQILGFLIESHPTGSTSLPEAYRILFQLILTPAFWDRSGNIPALSRLLQAYIEKGGENIVLEKLTVVLGIFQRLVSQSKVHDHEGFAILNSLVVHLPRIHLENYLKDIFVVIFTRLTKAKTQKLIKCIIIFFCYFVVKYGAQELITQVDNIQANMFQMVIDRLFLPELSKIDENDKKLCAIGVTHLLCDPIPMISGVYFVQLWLPLLQSLLQLFESSNELQTMSYAEKKKQAQEEAEEELLVGLDDTPDYTPAFSCLAFAKKPHIDIFSTSIPDARCHLAKCLQTLTASHPNQFLNLMKTGLSTEHLSHIQKYCSLANVTLI
ncbi:unnamed protein product [Rotaria socialis]|uniref:Exportin-2 n=1 Tax=Rotaria socialis TaxID=392032 RepID=A0A821MXI9_9BILA|nr:unnamed protein product [Rotaria socialis]CAF3458894.1 unnamed protein product [Rotaria socialis]CAF3511915.1 unnamed protein product [Rotaria socialis]CAF4616622.1 unnamed protein product [Rotaria socialis]CAF4723844.1 unnamed protein product [Rotaria socialis]